MQPLKRGGDFLRQLCFIIFRSALPTMGRRCSSPHEEIEEKPTDVLAAVVANVGNLTAPLDKEVGCHNPCGTIYVVVVNFGTPIIAPLPIDRGIWKLTDLSAVKDSIVALPQKPARKNTGDI